MQNEKWAIPSEAKDSLHDRNQEEHPLTLEDWVLAEKDLIDSLESDGLLKR